MGIQAQSARHQLLGRRRWRQSVRGAQRGKPRQHRPRPRRVHRRHRQRGLALRRRLRRLHQPGLLQRPLVHHRQLGQHPRARRRDRPSSLDSQHRHRRQGIAGVGRRPTLRARGQRPLCHRRSRLRHRRDARPRRDCNARRTPSRTVRLTSRSLQPHLPFHRSGRLLPRRPSGAVQGRRNRSQLSTRASCLRRNTGAPANHPRRSRHPTRSQRIVPRPSLRLTRPPNRPGHSRMDTRRSSRPTRRQYAYPRGRTQQRQNRR